MQVRTTIAQVVTNPPVNRRKLGTRILGNFAWAKRPHLFAAKLPHKAHTLWTLQHQDIHTAWKAAKFGDGTGQTNHTVTHTTGNMLQRRRHHRLWQLSLFLKQNRQACRQSPTTRHGLCSPQIHNRFLQNNHTDKQ